MRCNKKMEKDFSKWTTVSGEVVWLVDFGQ
jgi:hypothetical protein